MVRYAKEERGSLSDIENAMIRTSSGGEVPFFEVADVDFGKGYSAIKRADRNRVITITADVDETLTNANEINADLTTTILPAMAEIYPKLSWSFEGAQKQQAKTMGSLAVGFAIAMFVIYALLALPFRSYIQPFVIMSAIPFGFVGAIFGHLVMGYNVSIISLLGVVALAGIVVNDSLVLIDFINARYKEGLPLFDSIVLACKQRFRAILLTTLTTFFGLLPMILETSLQAKFLIPMALTLGFGVVAATGITLILVPAGVIIVGDMVNWFRKTFHRERQEVLVSGE